MSTGTVDLDRRFGGMARLYGVRAAARVRQAHAVVVGVGGVGSWVVEALARSGIGALTLIDLDHVAESNINRQVQALGATVGQAKVQALAQRVADIHPACAVRCIEEFVEAGNWPGLLAGREVDVTVDACDQLAAKAAMAAWALSGARAHVCIGAAGGKRQPAAVEVGDLAEVTHDPLLAKLRYQLRRQHAAARSGRLNLACVFSREAVAPPDPSCSLGSDGSLNCHGYGSAVMVTAAFGMVAAARAVDLLLAAPEIRL